MEFKNETDKLDQHFLIDEKVISRFIDEASLKKSDVVVEVGPGKGNISALIASKVKKLYLIEIDQRLGKYLIPFTERNDNVEIIFDNVLDTYIPECDKIITSLPYSITEPFIKKVIKCNFKELFMITGSNYASNVIKNDISKLSLLTNCFFKVEKIMDILPESFNPKPRVLSSMIKLVKINENDLNDTLVIFRNLFFYGNKKVKNALIESFIRINYLKGNKLTQKESKEIVKNLDINQLLLSKTFEIISNDELKYLYEKIENYFKK